MSKQAWVVIAVNPAGKRVVVSRNTESAALKKAHEWLGKGYLNIKVSGSYGK
ncbi:MAG: hypothetical protein PHQ43_00805 [Dehalococcoidales bacterium]|nr:hypothetical protein [Dehalococcoidales bacterium]